MFDARERQPFRRYSPPIGAAGAFVRQAGDGDLVVRMAARKLEFELRLLEAAECLRVARPIGEAEALIDLARREDPDGERTTLLASAAQALAQRWAWGRE